MNKILWRGPKKALAFTDQRHRRPVPAPTAKQDLVQEKPKEEGHGVQLITNCNIIRCTGKQTLLHWIAHFRGPFLWGQWSVGQGNMPIRISGLFPSRLHSGTQNPEFPVYIFWADLQELCDLVIQVHLLGWPMGKENSQGLDVGWDIHIHLKIPYELQVVREGERANGLNWYLVWAT